MTQKQKNHTFSAISILFIITIVSVSAIYIANAYSQSKNIDIKKSHTNPESDTQIFTDPIWSQPVTINKLKAESRDIFIGEPISNICLRSNDEAKVRTVYKFRVSQVLKGNLTENIIVNVGLPGGFIPLGEDNLLKVITPGYKKLQNNKTYLLFTKKKTSQELTPTRGPQGIFEIVENTMVSHGKLAIKNSKEKNKNYDKDKFIEELKSIIEKD